MTAIICSIDEKRLTSMDMHVAEKQRNRHTAYIVLCFPPYVMLRQF